MNRPAKKPDEVTLIAGRYRVDKILGHGGVAAVYGARDESTGKVVAVKWLQKVSDDCKQAKLTALFEREYHTLAHLTHPSVIEVYDYGVYEGRPYYTMERLEGSDLWDSAPLPWKTVCAILRDVFSCLALLHSRRLIHRDISPRNIRLTSEGRAKLIDFGSLAVMGKAKDLVGTPSFVAPEVINGLALDGSVDLFAAGAVAYWALTRRRPYPARRLSEMKDVFRSKPAEVSTLLPGVPPALNNLVMSLISLDPLARPSSAAEVIERLTGIATLSEIEPLGVAQAYLNTPTLVERDEALVRFRKQMMRAVAGAGSSIMVHARPGMGRSRLLASYVLEGKIAGAIVLQADGEDGKQGNFGVVRALIEDLLQAIPDSEPSNMYRYASLLAPVIPALAQIANQTSDLPREPIPETVDEQYNARIQRVLNNWLLSIARERCVVITVDDVHRADAPSAAVLAMLAHEAPQHKLVVAVTADLNAQARSPKAVELLSQAGARIKLRALDLDGTEKLLRSVFGQAANLKTASDWLYYLAQGNPRMSMELAQHLVDRHIAVYRAGGWTLPEDLRGEPLPQSVEQALDTQVKTLSEPALALAQTLSLTIYFAPLGLAGVLTLFSETYGHQGVFSALEELVAAHILVGADDRYRFKQRDLAETVLRGLSDQRRRDLHLKLAKFYQTSGAYSAFIAAFHYQQAGADKEGLQAALATSSRTRITDPVFRSTYGVQTLEAALGYAQQNDRSAIEQFRLRKALLQLSAFFDPSLSRHADKVIKQLSEDAGLVLWDQVDPSLKPDKRIKGCIQLAQARFDATPEALRGLEPNRAIRELAVCALMVSSAYSREIDIDKLKTLPPLLERYRTLSPLLDLIYEAVSIIVDQSMARSANERIRMLCAQVEYPVAGLDEASRTGLLYGFTYYLALEQAALGKPSAFASAELLVQQPNYTALGWQVRMVAHLYRGESRQAAECRDRRELLAIQNVDSNIHLVTGVLYEAYAYTLIGDLLELRRILDIVEKHAEKHPGWRPHWHYLRGSFYALRGEFDLAKTEIEKALSGIAPGQHNAWWCTIVHYVRLLLETGQYAQAKEVSKRAIDSCETRGVSSLFIRYVEIGLALAEAKTGDTVQAVARMDKYIEQAGLEGVQGIFLGYAYESRARAAICDNDREAFDKFAKLTADVYLSGNSGPLANKYHKLLREARGTHLAPARETIAPKEDTETPSSSFFSIATTAIRAELDMCRGPRLRAQHVLRLLVEHTRAIRGYLYGLQNNGLNLVAAHDGQAPPVGLEERVNALLSYELAEKDTTSIVSDLNAADGEHQEQCFVDHEGQTYHLIALSSRQEGRTLLTGVAVLNRRRDQRLRMPTSEFVAALSDGLLGAGDVTAVVVQ